MPAKLDNAPITMPATICTRAVSGLAGGAVFCLLAISILMASSSIMAANIFIRCALGKPETK